MSAKNNDLDNIELEEQLDQLLHHLSSPQFDDTEKQSKQIFLTESEQIFLTESAESSIGSPAQRESPVRSDSPARSDSPQSVTFANESWPGVESAESEKTIANQVATPLKPETDIPIQTTLMGDRKAIETSVETPVVKFPELLMTESIGESETTIDQELHSAVWQYLLNDPIRRYQKLMKIPTFLYYYDPRMRIFLTGGRAYTVEFIRALFEFVDLSIPLGLSNILVHQVSSQKAQKRQEPTEPTKEPTQPAKPMGEVTSVEADLYAMKTFLGVLPWNIGPKERKIDPAFHRAVWRILYGSGEGSGSLIDKHLAHCGISYGNHLQFTNHTWMKHMFLSHGRAYTVECIRYLYDLHGLKIPQNLECLLQNAVIVTQRTVTKTSMETEETTIEVKPKQAETTSMQTTLEKSEKFDTLSDESISPTETKIGHDHHKVIWTILFNRVQDFNISVIDRYLGLKNILYCSYSMDPHMQHLFFLGGRAYTVEYLRQLYRLVDLKVPQELEDIFKLCEGVKTVPTLSTTCKTATAVTPTMVAGVSEDSTKLPNVFNASVTGVACSATGFCTSGTSDTSDTNSKIQSEPNVSTTTTTNTNASEPKTSAVEQITKTGRSAPHNVVPFPYDMGENETQIPRGTGGHIHGQIWEYLEKSDVISHFMEIEGYISKHCPEMKHYFLMGGRAFTFEFIRFLHSYTSIQMCFEMAVFLELYDLGVAKQKQDAATVLERTIVEKDQIIAERDNTIAKMPRRVTMKFLLPETYNMIEKDLICSHILKIKNVANVKELDDAIATIDLASPDIDWSIFGERVFVYLFTKLNKTNLTYLIGYHRVAVSLNASLEDKCKELYKHLCKK